MSADGDDELLPALACHGNAPSTVKGKEQASRTFEIFLGSSPKVKAKYGGAVSWKDLDDATLCSDEIYREYLFFLLHQHVANTASERLAGSTIEAYVRKLLTIVRDRFKCRASS